MKKKQNKRIKKTKKVNIILTEKQLIIYRDALEFFSRFLSGQSYLPIALELLLFKGKNRNIIYKALGLLLKLIYPDLPEHASYGISNHPDKEMRRIINISYEMYREVYVWSEKQQPTNDRISCYKSPTLKVSDEPLPVVETLKQNK